jgi:hypothetical protein
VQHDHPEPISAPYRFSVRTDREGNRMIEQLAKASGISSTAYVQRHFETIFPQVDAGVMPTIAPAEVSSAVDNDGDFNEAAVKRGRKPNGETEARILAKLRSKAAADGTVRMSVWSLGAACGTTQETARQHLLRLIDRGLVGVVCAGTRGKRTVYRVKPEVAQNAS